MLLSMCFMFGFFVILGHNGEDPYGENPEDKGNKMMHDLLMSVFKMAKAANSSKDMKPEPHRWSPSSVIMLILSLS